MDFSFMPDDKRMRYVLYDLRKDPDPQSALANVHLPRAEDDGPVLIRVEVEQYQDMMYGLREMCVNEGDEWVTTMLSRPDYAPTNTGDLEPNAIYILIAHISLFLKNPYEFMDNLRSMKKLVLH